MNENTWPNPARPGVPLNPDRDGWHWLEDTVDGVGTGHLEAVYYAAWSVPIWYRAGNRSPITKPKEWRYLGPCLTPAEIAAKDARIAELEALVKEAFREGFDGGKEEGKELGEFLAGGGDARRYETFGFLEHWQSSNSRAALGGTDG